MIDFREYIMLNESIAYPDWNYGVSTKNFLENKGNRAKALTYLESLAKDKKEGKEILDKFQNDYYKIYKGNLDATKKLVNEKSKEILDTALSLKILGIALILAKKGEEHVKTVDQIEGGPTTTLTKERIEKVIFEAFGTNKGTITKRKNLGSIWFTPYEPSKKENESPTTKVFNQIRKTRMNIDISSKEGNINVVFTKDGKPIKTQGARFFNNEGTPINIFENPDAFEKNKDKDVMFQDKNGNNIKVFKENPLTKRKSNEPSTKEKEETPKKQDKEKEKEEISKEQEKEEIPKEQKKETSENTSLAKESRPKDLNIPARENEFGNTDEMSEKVKEGINKAVDFKKQFYEMANKYLETAFDKLFISKFNTYEKTEGALPEVKAYSINQINPIKLKVTNIADKFERIFKDRVNKIIKQEKNFTKYAQPTEKAKGNANINIEINNLNSDLAAMKSELYKATKLSIAESKGLKKIRTERKKEAKETVKKAKMSSGTRAAYEKRIAKREDRKDIAGAKAEQTKEKIETYAAEKISPKLNIIQQRLQRLKRK